jgi:hypothetical protein
MPKKYKMGSSHVLVTLSLSIVGALSLKQQQQWNEKRGNARIKWEGVSIQFSENQATGTPLSVESACTSFV